MYLIRETFIAKPGHAGEFVELMKNEMANWKDFKGYILLDMVTDYNKIVIEFEIQSLVDFENMMNQMKSDQSKRKTKAPPKYTELYKTGKREIFKIIE